MDYRRKLTSRKLWLSIASFFSMLVVAIGYSDSVATEVSALIMAGATVIGYVIGEGLADSGDAPEQNLGDIESRLEKLEEKIK